MNYYTNYIYTQNFYKKQTNDNTLNIYLYNLYTECTRMLSYTLYTKGYPHCGYVCTENSSFTTLGTYKFRRELEKAPCLYHSSVADPRQRKEAKGGAAHPLGS